jgi:starch synthase
MDAARGALRSRPMRILQACAEIFPLLKTGGLADVAGALPDALRAQGADVRVVLPGFAPILRGLRNVRVVASLQGMLGAPQARLLLGTLEGLDLQAYVIDAQALYVRNGGPYADVHGRPYADNHRRFAPLGYAAAALAHGLDTDWKADLVHAHDWHAALTCAYLQTRADRPGLVTAPVPSVFTVHNLAYQGTFDAQHFPELGLPSSYFTPVGMEFHGRMSFMKGGLCYASHITTVSPTYAQEIQSEEQGCGLDGVMRERRFQLTGVLNGVDSAVWHPAQDKYLPQRYDVRAMDGKAHNKRFVQRSFGLREQTTQPLLCVVSRLTEQKGLQLLVQALPSIVQRGWQLALVGSGDAALEKAFNDFADQYPQQVAVRLGYHEPLAHQMMAGSDIIVVPSRFEPCGLTQLYGLAYGTLPMVRRVGGLADTVNDAQLATIDSDATGFAFDEFTVQALSEAMDRAHALWQRPEDWRMVQTRAMNKRFGWDSAARQYMSIYRALLKL